jgi:hypothetical protein
MSRSYSGNADEPAALDAGLVDNKVVSFSEPHTSLRLVIRLRDRI